MKNVHFGTDGIRGVANDELTSELAYRIGRFIGQYPNGKKNKILLARDTRISGEMLSCALTAGILASGSFVYDIEISTTPSISFLVNNYDFDYGIMISASHNPYYDNGIKIFNKNGEKLENSIEKMIESYIYSPYDYLPFATNNDLGRKMDASSLKRLYIDFLLSQARGIKKINILVDCANGSSSNISKEVFSKLGVNATYINDKPNGLNINDRCGSTHLNSLIAECKKGKYDLCFAFDGDADRLMCLNSNGQIIDGDCTIFLNALSFKKEGHLHDNKVVITVMSNMGLKKALIANGIDILEVAVGDKYVQAALKENKLSLGGEQSGHIIFLDDLNTGDGFLTAIHLMNIYCNDNVLFTKALQELTIYPQLLENITVTNKDAIMTNEGLKQHIINVEKRLDGEGRILVRPSGTEPLIRVMCEAKTIQMCHQICDDIVEYIKELSF